MFQPLGSCEVCFHEHDVQISRWYPNLNSCEYIPRRVIAGLYGNSIFKFFREIHSVFNNDCFLTDLIPEILEVLGIRQFFSSVMCIYALVCMSQKRKETEATQNGEEEIYKTVLHLDSSSIMSLVTNIDYWKKTT